MKIKNLLMGAVLAAGMLLTGCGNDFGKEIVSSKPAEIEGFDGNVGDVAPKSGDLIAEIEIESFGTIKAVLFPEAAPVGVDNFQKLCDSGFYKGLKIHRVVKDFMFQGGSANGDGTGGDALVNGGRFPIETAQNARHFYGALCYANAGPENNSTQFYIVNNKTSVDIENSVNTDYYKNVLIQGGIKYLNENGKNLDEAYIGQILQEIQGYQNTVDFVENASDEIKARYGEKGGAPFLDGNYTVFGQVYEGFDVIDSISAADVTDNGAGEISKPVQDIIIKDITVSAFNG